MVAQCTFHQLVRCLGELGLTEEQAAEVVVDLVNSQQVQLVNPIREMIESRIH